MLTTNCSNNYGPFQFPEKLIPLMILNALEGKPLPVYGDGGRCATGSMWKIIARPFARCCEEGRVGETYNIGGNSERKNIDVVNAICDLVDEMQSQSPASARAGN